MAVFTDATELIEFLSRNGSVNEATINTPTSNELTLRRLFIATLVPINERDLADAIGKAHPISAHPYVRCLMHISANDDGGQRLLRLIHASLRTGLNVRQPFAKAYHRTFTLLLQLARCDNGDARQRFYAYASGLGL